MNLFSNFFYCFWNTWDPKHRPFKKKVRKSKMFIPCAFIYLYRLSYLLKTRSNFFLLDKIVQYSTIVQSRSKTRAILNVNKNKMRWLIFPNFLLIGDLYFFEKIMMKMTPTQFNIFLLNTHMIDVIEDTAIRALEFSDFKVHLQLLLPKLFLGKSFQIFYVSWNS